jgi:hypothetical protein
MKAQTAVEWLVKILHGNGYLNQKPETSSVSGQSVLRIVNAAKEMEKEQIENAYNTSFRLRDKPYQTAEKYYQETYKQD